jgi:hypothetical protein
MTAIGSRSSVERYQSRSTPIFLDRCFGQVYNWGMGRFVLAILGLLILAAGADAQVLQQQAVQLPTFEYIGVATTIIVPIHATMPVGRMTYSGHRRTAFDKVGDSLNQRPQAANFHMEVTVIDHAENDRQLLAEAARRRGAKSDVLGRPVEDRNQVYLRRARDAEATSRVEVAKVFYLRAAK